MDTNRHQELKFYPCRETLTKEKPRWCWRYQTDFKVFEIVKIPHRSHAIDRNLLESEPEDTIKLSCNKSKSRLLCCLCKHLQVENLYDSSSFFGHKCKVHSQAWVSVRGIKITTLFFISNWSIMTIGLVFFALINFHERNWREKKLNSPKSRSCLVSLTLWFLPDIIHLHCRFLELDMQTANQPGLWQ